MIGKPLEGSSRTWCKPMNITTLLGEIPAESLGFCQCHEHILMSKGVSFQVHKLLCIDDPEKSLAELKAYKVAGGSALVDAQPVGCNRMASKEMELSKVSGVHIIGSTGFHKMCFYPENHWNFTASEDEIAQLYIRELTVGMYDDGEHNFPSVATTAKAGQIKTALDKVNLTAPYKKLFSAAVTASKATGKPIMVHIEQGSDPLALLDFFLERDMAPEKLIFCHMDRAIPEIEIILAVAKAGVYLEFDTIGRFNYHSDDRELEIIQSVLDAGYENQLLCSLDTTRGRLQAYDPAAVGLTYIRNTFLPAMEKAGITDGQLAKIFRVNPAQAFGV